VEGSGEISESSGELPSNEEPFETEMENSGDKEEFDPQKEEFLWWTNIFRLDREFHFPQ